MTGRTENKCTTMEGVWREENEDDKVITASCPSCDKVLNVASVKIEEQPAIRLGFRFAEGEDKSDHLLYVSSIWGSMNLVAFPPIPKGAVLELFCPLCKRDFPISAMRCGRCQTPVIRLQANYHDVILVCSRRGCPEHSMKSADDQYKEDCLFRYRTGP